MRNTQISDIVKIMPIDKLKPYPNNPRKNEHAVEPVANSIREFGFKQPIVIDKDNTIIAGHTRLLAAKELGLTEVPVIVADDLTPEQVKAYRLADNKTGELAEWDFEQLDIELGGIHDIEMSDLGFIKEPLEPPKNIDDILQEENLQDVLVNPMWLVARAKQEEENFINTIAAQLRERNIKVDIYYGSENTNPKFRYKAQNRD